jgi:hypothetical protein
MSNKISSQKGSTHVIIIVILVVALLGALGFVFWQNFMNKPAPANNETSKVEDKKQDTPHKETPVSDQLTLNDWGIKFTIAPSLKSTEIKYQAKGPDTYVFTTSRIEALGGECAKSPFGDTVSLTRYAEKPIATPDGELLNTTPINNYYFVLSGPISSCSSLNSSQQPAGPVNAIETADREALNTTIKTLSAK